VFFVDAGTPGEVPGTSLGWFLQVLQEITAHVVFLSFESGRSKELAFQNAVFRTCCLALQQTKQR
jgi:hypothetical protein